MRSCCRSTPDRAGSIPRCWAVEWKSWETCRQGRLRASWDDMGSHWIQPSSRMFKVTSERCLSPNLGEFCRFSHPTLGLRENEVGTPQFFFVRKCAFPSNWPMLGGGNSFFPCELGLASTARDSGPQVPRGRVGGRAGDVEGR